MPLNIASHDVLKKKHTRRSSSMSFGSAAVSTLYSTKSTNIFYHKKKKVILKHRYVSTNLSVSIYGYYSSPHMFLYIKLIYKNKKYTDIQLKLQYYHHQNRLINITKK